MDPVVFEVVPRPSMKNPTYEVVERGGRHVAEYWQEGGAKRHADHLNREHAGGRVAQGHCDNGHPCDWPRIHVPSRVPQEEPLVLCLKHREALAEARRRGWP